MNAAHLLLVGGVGFCIGVAVATFVFVVVGFIAKRRSLVWPENIETCRRPPPGYGTRGPNVRTRSK